MYWFLYSSLVKLFQIMFSSSFIFIEVIYWHSVVSFLKSSEMTLIFFFFFLTLSKCLCWEQKHLCLLIHTDRACADWSCSHNSQKILWNIWISTAEYSDSIMSWLVFVCWFLWFFFFFNFLLIKLMIFMILFFAYVEIDQWQMLVL